MPGTMRHIFRTMIFGAVALALGACSQSGDSDDKSSGAAQTSNDLDITTARREVFYWDVTTIFALTDGGYVFIDQIPEGITTLVDTPAQDLLILATFVEDEPGNIVGIASELEEFDQPVTPDGLHDATWTLKLTGRGTLIGHRGVVLPALYWRFGGRVIPQRESAEIYSGTEGAAFSTVD